MTRKTDNFNKFINKKKSNAAIKEEFRQEKRAVKKERREAIEKHFEEKRKLKFKGPDPAEARRQEKGGRKDKDAPSRKPGPPSEGRVADQSANDRRKHQSTKTATRQEEDRIAESFEARSRKNKPSAERKPDKAARGKTRGPVKPSKAAHSERSNKPEKGEFPGNKHREDRREKGESFEKKGLPGGTGKPGKIQQAVKRNAPVPAGAAVTKDKIPAGGSAVSKSRGPSAGSDLLPLNKYIAHSGVCSRRDAADLIRDGKVLVNGQPVTEPGTKVSPDDQVKVNGKKVTISRNFVYILLNKPKDYITTTEDPQGRRTVLDLIRHATEERVYPVGRLDRNTSGVLLLTNDGELAQKLAHPKHEIRKIYHATLDKALTKADFEKIVSGVVLDDGPAHVDAIAYADIKDKTQIGLEIHSGRNRIVRRIFESLGYDVRGLDRVMYATLTKKNVQRGKWRLLSEKEVRILKYMNNSAVRS